MRREPVVARVANLMGCSCATKDSNGDWRQRCATPRRVASDRMSRRSSRSGIHRLLITLQHGFDRSRAPWHSAASRRFRYGRVRIHSGAEGVSPQKLSGTKDRNGQALWREVRWAPWWQRHSPKDAGTIAARCHPVRCVLIRSDRISQAKGQRGLRPSVRRIVRRPVFLEPCREPSHPQPRRSALCRLS